MTSRLVKAKAELHDVQEQAQLVAASLTAARAGREPIIVANTEVLQEMAKQLSLEQIKLALEIKRLEPSVNERAAAAVSRPVGAAVPEKSTNKRAKVQSTLIGFVLLRRDDDPSRLVPLEGPKLLDTTSPACSGCGRLFKTLAGAVEHS
jgi:hypothetical protein